MSASAEYCAPQPKILQIADCDLNELRTLLARYGLEIELLPANATIPGSYWGEREAGLIGKQLFVRADTPLHSALHEACHYICMDAERRQALHRDAGGDDDEENAVCYLQILLADRLGGLGSERMMRDMDAWGYTFRLGSAQAWFEQDASDTHRWLLKECLIDERGELTWLLRQ